MRRKHQPGCPCCDECSDTSFLCRDYLTTGTTGITITMDYATFGGGLGSVTQTLPPYFTQPYHWRNPEVSALEPIKTSVPDYGMAHRPVGLDPAPLAGHTFWFKCEPELESGVNSLFLYHLFWPSDALSGPTAFHVRMPVRCANPGNPLFFEFDPDDGVATQIFPIGTVWHYQGMESTNLNVFGNSPIFWASRGYRVNVP